MAEKIATRASYGRALVELGAENPDIVVLDADLSGSTQTKKFADVYPDRFFNALSESQASHLPTGFTFPYRDNAHKIILQYISHMIAEFEKRKLSKLRTDISGALF